ncbi:MAG: hypothetical protein HY976_00690 [Candidatus Kerfeldbacteria bacterium]|nr:hypothetical protein [Candidatus Kerfeldbacteria bacterium]
MQFRTELYSTWIIEPDGDLTDGSPDANWIDEHLIMGKVNFLNILIDCSKVRAIGRESLQVVQRVDEAVKKIEFCNFGDRIALVAATEAVQQVVKEYGLDLKHYPSLSAAMQDITSFHIERERARSRAR